MASSGTMSAVERVFIAGHKGLLGKATWTLFQKFGFQTIGLGSDELDLRNSKETYRYLEENRPHGIVFCAAKVGGIGANKQHGLEMLSDNASMQASVLENAAKIGIKKLIFISSAAIYPTDQTYLSEEDIWSAAPAHEHLHYAIGKLSAMGFISDMKNQGFQWISLIPTNIYGPGDRWNLESSHVIAALIIRMTAAKLNREETVEIWGSGSAEREFLFADDAAQAVFQSYTNLENAKFESYNVTSATSSSIRNTAEIIAEKVGYEGSLTFNNFKPTGPAIRKLNPNRLNQFIPWKASTPFDVGIEKCVTAYDLHVGKLK
jgi:GDP-L-fucose synthase